ncbi:hypothetical protein GCM10027436_52580 [Actinophytocola sediminis]
MLLTVAGCGGGVQGGTPGGQPELADTLWGQTFLLTEALTDGEPEPAIAGSEVSLKFTDDGRLVARARCNTMSGSPTLDSGRLVLDGLETTGMGCDPERHAQDEWLSGFLTGTPTWELADARLTLTGGATRLVLTERSVSDPDRPLAGTVWTVDTLVDGQSADSASSSAALPAPATVEFGPDQVSVFAGCNGGTATYAVDGDTITIDPLMLTRKACADEIMKLETAVVAVLDGSITFDIESAVLTVEHPSGKGLRLRAE